MWRLLPATFFRATDCRKAAEGVSIIYHLAAGMEKVVRRRIHEFGALATRNLMDAFLEWQAKAVCECQFLCGLFEPELETWRSLMRTCPLETASQERFDAYGFGKLKQEEIVKEYGARQ